jgi:hypothetical protein
MQTLLNIFAGHLAGWLCALGGAVKDSPHEGFKPLTFPRSIIVGTLGGILSLWFTDSFFLAFCFAGYFERACVEGWKIVRGKTPGKFSWGK